MQNNILDLWTSIHVRTYPYKPRMNDICHGYVRISSADIHVWITSSTLISKQNRLIRAISIEPVTESFGAKKSLQPKNDLAIPLFMQEFFYGNCTTESVNDCLNEWCRQCNSFQEETNIDILLMSYRSKHCLSQFWHNMLFIQARKLSWLF